MRRSTRCLAGLVATIAITLLAGGVWASVPDSSTHPGANAVVHAADGDVEMARVQLWRDAGDPGSEPCTGDGSCRTNLPSDPIPCSPGSGCATAGFLPTVGPSGSTVSPGVPRIVGTTLQMPPDFLLDLPSPPPRV